MPSYGVIDSVEELEKLVARVIDDKLPFGFDIETGYDGAPREAASLHPEEGFVCGFSFTNSTDWARYVPIRHDVAVNVPEEEFARVVWPLMRTGLGVAHNAKFEIRFLSKMFAEHVPESLESGGHFSVRSDTLIESYMLQEHPSHGLKVLVKQIFGHEQRELSSLFPDLAKGKMKTLRFNSLELTPEVIAYACEDAAWCLALHERNFPRVTNGATKFLYTVEMALLEVLTAMEEYGVYYDWHMMTTAAAELEVFLVKYRAEIMADLSALTGQTIDINLGSSKQISDVLFGMLGLKTTRMTKSSRDAGKPQKMSTDKIALAGLARKYPVVRKMTEWKELKKLHSTYLDKYPRVYAYAHDGRTHPNVLQCAVLTGRFAVSDPPYQQTPKKYNYVLSSGETFDFNFRNVIRAAPDHYLIGFDYSQVELRWLAGVTQEPKLLDDFRNDVDVHTTTAALMLGVPATSVTSEQRAIGKTMNFALLYGMQAKSLGERLGISKEEAERLYEQYFSAFSSIAVWVRRVTNDGRSAGFTTSHFGRRHRIWEFESPDHWIKAKGERLCVNAPIQGGAADYMKVAMVRQHSVLDGADLLDKVHLVMNIHDALVYEVHRSVSAAQVMEVLEPAVSFDVEGFPPIKAEWGLGVRWGSMIDVSLSDGQVVRLGEVEKDEVELDEDGNLEVVPVVAATLSQPVAPASVAPGPLETGTLGAIRDPVVEAPPDPDQPPREVLVQLTDFPTGSQFEQFRCFVSDRPGNNSLVLVTPEGDRVPMADATNVGIDHASQVSMIFHGATVAYTAESVNIADITAGLSL